MSELLWEPSKKRIQESNFQKYFQFLKKEYHREFKNYDELYAWSVQEIPVFWESVWKFCGIKASPYSRVIGRTGMPGTEWFLDAQFNFAEHLLRFRDDQEALVSVGEDREIHRLTYRELYQKVAQSAYFLRKMGVTKGDRICAFVPNISEVVIAMLATSSIGGIWSSCSPDFGARAILDRFGQIQPKILFTVDGYSYNGKKIDLLDRISEVAKHLPSLEKIIVIPYSMQQTNLSRLPNAVGWSEFLANNETRLEFCQLPFNHPLYILYSSGTTGIPKCIVHGQGGTLIQHLKEQVLHTDLKREDKICYITTCGWMMWNWLVSSLAVGATVVLSEGSATYPDLYSRWKMVDQEKITIFGLSPKFISLCEKERIKPKKMSKFPHLKTILSTGSPLSEENFGWVYAQVKKDLQLSSICGGTDIISCFMLGNPLLPVYAGEIQCRGLGMKVEAFDERGKSVIGEKGELVCTAPFPSMPVHFWNDEKEQEYKKAYFKRYPNIWHHGDFIAIMKHGGVIVYGRSDATLNPGGVRIGTAEIYRQLEGMSEIKDCIAVGQRWENDVRIILFVILLEGESLTSHLVEKIKKTIREGASARHVPAKIVEVTDIPYTMSGKKVEIAVAQVIHGEIVKNVDALMNPEALSQFKNRTELRS